MSQSVADKITLVDKKNDTTGVHKNITAILALVIIACTLSARLGLNFGGFSLSFALIFAYIALFFAWVDRILAVDTTSFFCYLALVSTGVVSFIFANSFDDKNRATLGSFLLLCIIYLPLIFRVTLKDSEICAAKLKATFIWVGVVCAIAGVLQFSIQKLVNLPWLFDFTEYIPNFLRATEGYNTTIRTNDGINKANGFFLREPSGFSFLMGMCFLVEMQNSKRLHMMALFITGLLLSYSGTGILTILIGLILLMKLGLLLRFLLIAPVLACLYMTTDDFLNLSFTLSRVSEFSESGSSGYIRYIAPARLISETILDKSWALFTGYGPGSITRTTVGFEFHDPTWAKLIFEYGLTGFVAALVLAFNICKESSWGWRCGAVFFVSWLVMGGNLLAPASVMMLWVFGVVMKQEQTASHTESIA